MPKKVSKGSNNIEYIHDAAGNKLAKKANGEFVNFYCGSIVYRGDKKIDYIVHPEGLVRDMSGWIKYQYNFTDHLGNVRAVVDDGNNAVQTTDYYPFGLAHQTSSLQTNKYLYNGKEIQNDVIGGTYLGWYDYGARPYDPYKGRWDKVDPMVEERVSFSSYNYCSNSPINRIALDGMLDDEWEYNVTTGETTHISNAGGDQEQTVTLKETNENGETTTIGTATVTGKNAYVYSMRDGYVITNYDAYLSNNYNTNNGYEYRMSEFLQRNKYLRMGAGPLQRWILKTERYGRPGPITESAFYEYYGAEADNVKTFLFLDLGASMAGPPGLNHSHFKSMRGFSSMNFAKASILAKGGIITKNGVMHVFDPAIKQFRTPWQKFVKDNFHNYGGDMSAISKAYKATK